VLVHGDVGAAEREEVTLYMPRSSSRRTNFADKQFSRQPTLAVEVKP